jgi:protein SCO1/2
MMYCLSRLVRRLRGCLIGGAAILLVMTVTGCQSPPEPLPILNTPDIPYSFFDQTGASVSVKDLRGTVYITAFFFTSCPTICPIMKTQMVRIYEAFTDDDDVVLFSHTVDPTHDTVEVLAAYGERLGISAERWRLVTGEKDEIYDTARRFGLGVREDEQAPGGYIHSGSFVLVDRLGRIRGYYRGTEEEAVDRLIADIRRLLDEPA